MTTLVAVESPLAGEYTLNTEYARECLLDSIRRGEAPFAMHLLYPQVLADSDPAERAMGISCGLAWTTKADLHAFYLDRGFSPGMRLALEAARSMGHQVVGRTLFSTHSPQVTEDAERWELRLQGPPLDGLDVKRRHWKEAPT